MRLAGNVDIDVASTLFRDLRRLAHRDLEDVCIDFAEVEAIDSAGVAALELARETLQSEGKHVDFRSLSDVHRAALALRPPRETVPTEHRPAPGMLERIGARGRRSWEAFVGVGELSIDTIRSGLRCLVGRERFPWGRAAEQAAIIGADALPIVALLSLLLGIIMAFQAAYQLEEFGATIYTADLTGLGMMREFGAFITAIILAGRTGAAIAAELGTMRVKEEIDALVTMGLSPERLLVLPRMAAITVVGPALSLMSMVIGILGALAIAPALDLSWVALANRMRWVIGPNDVALGLVKSLLFAWTIGLAGCFVGLRTRGGATAVGRSATLAVVASIFFIIVIDSIVTTVWTLGH